MQGNEIWDAAVVGAGVAGSVAAAVLAGRGWRVLLVEKAEWPREKACGGCVNAAAVKMLHEAGLGNVLAGGAVLEWMELRWGARRIRMALPAGVAVERKALDARLVAEAAARGAKFLPGTRARLLAIEEGCAWRVVRLEDGEGSREIRARVVLACDGLRGGLLANERWAEFKVDRRVRLGFATTLEAREADDIPAGVLGMYAGEAGYVGIVRLAGGRLHVGAALAPGACHARRGPARVIEGILRGCRCKAPEGLSAAEFAGTGPLTGSRGRVAAERVLVVGDSCGYVEPFTGEGISWAVRGAMAATALLPARPEEWSDDAPGMWQRRYGAEIRRRQRWCRGLREILHRPAVAAGCARMASYFPWAPEMVARRISA